MGQDGQQTPAAQPPLRCQTTIPPLPRRTPIAEFACTAVTGLPVEPTADSGSPIMRWHSVEEVVRERGSEGSRIMLRGRAYPGRSLYNE